MKFQTVRNRLAKHSTSCSSVFESTHWLPKLLGKKVTNIELDLSMTPVQLSDQKCNDNNLEWYASFFQERGA